MTLAAEWRRPLTNRVTLLGSASVSAMDDAFAQTYYGVGEATSVASGLSEYRPQGGIRISESCLAQPSR